jgi:hypothetical protein
MEMVLFPDQNATASEGPQEAAEDKVMEKAGAETASQQEPKVPVPAAPETLSSADVVRTFQNLWTSLSVATGTSKYRTVSDFRSRSAASNVASYTEGNKDPQDRKIGKVFVFRLAKYAIYKTDDSESDVIIKFADDDETETNQRALVLPLASTRAEINSLLTGWHNRKVYDRKIAIGLQLALDGDPESGKSFLAATKQELFADRGSAGRFQYLKWAFGTAFIFLNFLFIASHYYPFPDTSSNLWLAAKAGLVGAAFSIALGIRNRTVGLDLNRLDNITDGVLRLLIGVIAAGVLLLILASGILPNMKIGDMTVAGGINSWKVVMVVGFIGGFLERLVPDLLEKGASPAASNSVAK